MWLKELFLCHGCRLVLPCCTVKGPNFSNFGKIQKLLLRNGLGHESQRSRAARRRDFATP
jgi:hypothetical protein